MLTVFCLMGPTGSGKSQLALDLAQKFPVEIISVDSAMVYRGMDIGTAKPTLAELAIAPHFLIDVCDPSENYSAGTFHRDATALIKDILARGKIPLLVGGTMLYFRVLQQGIASLPEADLALRQKFVEQAAELGWVNLHKRLQEIDPLSAARINPQDAQRIQRALEVFELTGKTLSECQTETRKTRLPFRTVNIVLWPEQREILNQRLTMRFQEMIKLGFVEEVELLYQRGDLHGELPSMRSVGYRQIWQYLTGESTKAQMQENAVIATRQLAKRQLTWLRNWPNCRYFSCYSRQLYSEIDQLFAQFL